MSAAKQEKAIPEDAIGALLEKTAAGDRGAFRTLYSQASPKLMGVLVRILQNRAEAEDALQDVFIRIWERAAQYSPDRGAGLGWVVAVTRNHALDRIRRRPETRGFRQAQARDEDGQDPLERIADGTPSAEADLIAAGEARRVMDCFDELENDRAQAVKGAYLDGLSYKQLAERHGVNMNTMRTWLRRGLLRLRECISR